MLPPLLSSWIAALFLRFGSDNKQPSVAATFKQGYADLFRRIVRDRKGCIDTGGMQKKAIVCELRARCFQMRKGESSIAIFVQDFSRCCGLFRQRIMFIAKHVFGYLYARVFTLRLHDRGTSRDVSLRYAGFSCWGRCLARILPNPSRPFLVWVGDCPINSSTNSFVFPCNNRLSTTSETSPSCLHSSKA